jgi:membrane protein required for colicin V production
MTLIDYVVLAIVGFSVLLSVLRGFVRELLALAAWVVAFIVARLFGGDLAAIMPAEISGEELRWLAGFTTLFLSVLLAMSLVAVAVAQLIKSAGLSVEDRLLGAVFGLFRGAAVVVALALLAGATSLPRQPVWREAALRPLLELAALGVKGWLPPALAQHIKYG